LASNSDHVHVSSAEWKVRPTWINNRRLW